MDAIEMYEHELRQKAREEGALEAHRATLRKLLRLKFGELEFGELAGTIGAKITAADGAELERWTERILKAATIDEVFEA